jgi:UDP-N-acetylglucosamine 2-epimerase
MMETYQLRVRERRIKLIEPVSYLNMIKLMSHARMILTDSGGVQREAYWLRTPCLVLREETEWVETVNTGWNLLVGTDTKKIVEGMKRLEGSKPREKRRELFGDGKASEQIVQILLERQVHR